MTQNYNHIPTLSFKGKLYLSDVYGINFLKELGYVISLFPVLVYLRVLPSQNIR